MKHYPAWKKDQINRKWRTILAILICGVLFFAAINGVLKTLSLNKTISKSSWDGRSPLIIVVGAKPPGIFVYTHDPTRLLLFRFDNGMYMINGKNNEPLVKVSDLVDQNNGKELARIISMSTGLKIDNYVIAEGTLSRGSVENNFKHFASMATPLKLLIQGLHSYNTNITRFDGIRLWWQVKAFSADRINMVDLTNIKQDVLTANNQMVLGIDESSLNFELAKYTKSTDVLKEGYKVKVENRSGSNQSLDLAVSFASTVGFDVNKASEGAGLSEKTTIFAGDVNSYGAKYLARIFDCDKISKLNEADSGRIEIILGRDFSNKYYP